MKLINCWGLWPDPRLASGMFRAGTLLSRQKPQELIRDREMIKKMLLYNPNFIKGYSK